VALGEKEIGHCGTKVHLAKPKNISHIYEKIQNVIRKLA
jgi:hypothetical protein